MLAGEVRYYEMEKRCFHRSGACVWILLSVSLVRDGDGVPLYFVARIQDIAQRKQDGEARRKSELHLRRIFENSNDIIYTHELEGRFTSINPAGLRLLGIGADTDSGAPSLADVLTPESYAWAVETFTAPAKEKGVGLVVHIAPDVPQYVVGDAGRLRQVLLNLVGNAVKFTQAGEVSIRVELPEPPSETTGTGGVDVILMDVQMPGMDGLAATALIRAQEAGSGRRMPIVAMTAHAMRGDAERCLAAGMDAYVSKPFDARHLLETVERLGGRAAVAAEDVRAASAG